MAKVHNIRKICDEVVRADIRMSWQTGTEFIEDHVKRQNHVAELLAVLLYSDVLDEDGNTREGGGEASVKSGEISHGMAERYGQLYSRRARSSGRRYGRLARIRCRIWSLALKWLPLATIA
jgi:hypothetical protein